MFISISILTYGPYKWYLFRSKLDYFYFTTTLPKIQVHGPIRFRLWRSLYNLLLIMADTRQTYHDQEEIGYILDHTYILDLLSLL